MNSPNENTTLGKLVGVGVGPGDPELLTLKAYRYIKDAPVIAYLSNDQGFSHAKSIAIEALSARQAIAIEIAINMPMSTQRNKANLAYDHGAMLIEQQLKQGRDVVFLCEGDPLFFGSFSYLLERLQGDYDCQVIAGISSINAASACIATPLTKQSDSFAVVSGRHSEQQLLETLQQHKAVVIIKAGIARQKIIKVLQQANRSKDACYMEYIGREQQLIEPDISQLPLSAGPYFSLFMISSPT